MIKIKSPIELGAIAENPYDLAALIKIVCTISPLDGYSRLKFQDKKLNDAAFHLVNLGVISQDAKGYKLTSDKLFQLTALKTKTKPVVAYEARKMSDLINAKATIGGENGKYFEIGKAFWAIIRENIKSVGISTRNIDNVDFKTWIDPVRLMITSDNVTIDQMRDVFQYLKENEFWKPNIQSTRKLRQKFHTLHSQYKSNYSANKEVKPKVSEEYYMSVVKDLNS